MQTILVIILMLFFSVIPIGIVTCVFTFIMKVELKLFIGIKNSIIPLKKKKNVQHKTYTRQEKSTVQVKKEPEQMNLLQDDADSLHGIF